MKKYLKLLAAALLIGVMLVSLAGCGTQQESISTTPKENPIVVNKDENTILFTAEVNGKYFYEPTRHAAAFKGGSNGEKAIFRGSVEPQAFYNALVEIGAIAGNNMTLENKETTNVKGDKLQVTVTWEGAEKEYDINEVIKDSTGKQIVMRFGGNLQNALDKKTGCLLCLDSCPVGITSNETYTYGAVEKRDEVGFTSNKDILPADGTQVTIKVKVVK